MKTGGLSIVTRSFLLVLAALLVAVGISLALYVSRPPMRSPPVSVAEVANMLREDAPPRPEGPPGRSLRIQLLASPPQPPANRDDIASGEVLNELSRRLQLDAALLRVELPVDRQLPRGRPGERILGEGSVVARQLPDGRWRTLTNAAQPFPNSFQRQTLLLVALGLALLLPLAWLFARALAAPIRQFAQGAHRLGHDAQAPPLPSSGPREVRAAVEAFNSMQSRIQRLLRERTQMVAAIAHDLRTPLTRLAFRLEGLPEPLNTKVASDIHEMKEMISAALEFIRDRETSGTRERLDLRALLERIVDDQADQGHDVTLFSGGPVVVEGVPLSLRRMLVNLLDNAVKYGERARVRLERDATAAVVEIDDDGPGIPQDRQQQVFEPFFRLESSRNRDTGGIGLGLATVRSIVLEHGGEITVTNRAGGGLRMTVRLPLPA